MKKLLSVILTISILLSFMSSFVFADNAPPAITARNALMINLNTDAVVYEKEADEQIFPASLTKLTTMLVAFDLITDYSEVITFNKKACYEDLVIGSSNINLVDEEEISLDDLMYAVAISSANEATNALAIHLCGSIQEFVSKMNDKAKELGALNTHFVNTHGLHDTSHYTTPRDMSLIAKAVFSNEKLVEYLSSSSHVIAPTNKTETKRTLITTNNLIRQNSGTYYKYCKAGKTGTTTAAGYNLISLAEKSDTKFILVAMNVEKKSGSTNTVFDDSKNLYNWAFENYKSAKVLSDSEIITEVPVELSVKGDHLVLIPESNVYSVIPLGMDITTLEREITANDKIFAPVKQGDVLGSITLKKDGVTYATANLVAATDIERSTVLYYLYLIEIFFKNIWVRVIGIILAVLLVIYIIVMISQNNRRRKKKLRTRIRF